MNFLRVIFSVYLFFHNLSITVAVIIWCLGQTAWSCIECWFSPNPFPAKMTWRWRSPWRQPCWSAWLGRGASWPTSGTAHWPKTLTNSPWPWKVNVCTQQFLQSAAFLSSFYLLFCCSFFFFFFFFVVKIKWFMSLLLLLLLLLGLSHQRHLCEALFGLDPNTQKVHKNAVY